MKAILSTIILLISTVTYAGEVKVTYNFCEMESQLAIRLRAKAYLEMAKGNISKTEADQIIKEIGEAGIVFANNITEGCAKINENLEAIQF